jgi:DNA polymerase III delta subunit
MPGCLAVMRRLLFQRETPMAMIALLEARIRDLIVYREAMDRGWLRLVAGARNATWGTMPPEGESLLVTALGRDYRSIHPFRLKLLVEQAAGFSLAELRRCQRTAAAAHRQLVTSSLPATLILDMMVIRALQPARGRAASARNAQTAPRR